MSGSDFFVDRFQEELPLGKVVDRPNEDGVVRGGIDVEGVIGVDHKALRIQPLMQPGWGRAGITYGPFKREGGLTFGIHILNGHNTSQTGHLGQSLPRRFKQWVVGSYTERPLVNIFKLIWKGNKRRQWKQIKRWIGANRRYRQNEVQEYNENLAVGWFPTSRPANPVDEGNAFIVHATGPENGELWATVGQHPLPVVRGLQNIPLYFVVILREQGAAYYAASLPGAKGVGSFPNMRPVAIDPFNADEELYAAIWQSVMGQIGFWVDTRVFGTRVTQLKAFSRWYGTAFAADCLQGEGSLDQTQAETGGQWQVVEGRIIRTHIGVYSEDEDSTAVLSLKSPPGLLHVMIDGSDNGSAGLVWRWQDEANYWQILVAVDGCRIYCCHHGELSEVAADSNYFMVNNHPHSLQLVEDTNTFSIFLDGNLLFNQAFVDERMAGGGGAGIRFSGSGNSPYLHNFEVHAAEIPLPNKLDFDPPWSPQVGREPVVKDEFPGGSGELSERPNITGFPSWSRILGSGRFIQTGKGGIFVEATADKPNPDRTAYTIPWSNPNFADVRVCVTPPGEKRGTGQRGRGGIIFWQDSKNYIIVNTWLDDYYEGASLSSFFYLDSYEDLYDAVWTNVGNRITWGQSYNLRVTFDGLNYMIHLNDEPVLYRALTDVYADCQPLSITQVGLVANWEWGHDTGTHFDNFMAFGREI